MKQQFLVNTPDTFRTYVYEHNRKIVPASAQMTVYWPGGEKKLIDGETMTVGADGLLSYSLAASQNSKTGTNYKASVAYDHDSSTNYATLFYDVVKSRLVKVITDEDIVTELPQLKDNGWRVHGVAEGGSSTTIVDSELKRYDSGYFTGGLASCLDKEETREVTDFDPSTGTVATTPFSSGVDAVLKSILTLSFSKEIQRAFEKIEEKIIRLGKRPELVLDPYDLREVHIYYSVAEVCKGLVTDNDTFWWELWKEYEKKADETFNGINFKYDTSGDGYIAGSESSARINIIRMGRR